VSTEKRPVKRKISLVVFSDWFLAVAAGAVWQWRSTRTRLPQDNPPSDIWQVSWPTSIHPQTDQQYFLQVWVFSWTGYVMLLDVYLRHADGTLCWRWHCIQSYFIIFKVVVTLLYGLDVRWQISAEHVVVLNCYQVYFWNRETQWYSWIAGDTWKVSSLCNHGF